MTEPIKWVNELGQTYWQPVNKDGEGLYYYVYPWDSNEKVPYRYRSKLLARYKGWRYRRRKAKRKWKRAD